MTDFEKTYIQQKASWCGTRYGHTSIKLVGTGDGPINGIDPVIKTNILDMFREKKYYLHIDDFFGGLIGQGCSAELHMTLEKCDID